MLQRGESAAAVNGGLEAALLTTVQVFTGMLLQRHLILTSARLADLPFLHCCKVAGV